MKKYIIIIVSLIIFVIVGILIFNVVPKQKETGTINNTTDSSVDTNTGQDPNQPTPQTPTVSRTDEELTSTIVKKSPSLVDQSTGKPIFSIVDKKSPLAGWYVITIRNNQTETSNASVVMTDIKGQLVVKAGPGTGLFNQPGLPNEVKQALMGK
jgi:cytoskeletal protein RodZ